MYVSLSVPKNKVVNKRYKEMGKSIVKLSGFRLLRIDWDTSLMTCFCCPHTLLSGLFHSYSKVQSDSKHQNPAQSAAVMIFLDRKIHGVFKVQLLDRDFEKRLFMGFSGFPESLGHSLCPNVLKTPEIF